MAAPRGLTKLVGLVGPVEGLENWGRPASWPHPVGRLSWWAWSASRLKNTKIGMVRGPTKPVGLVGPVADPRGPTKLVGLVGPVEGFENRGALWAD